MTWRIVKDYKRGVLVDCYTLCPECWADETLRAAYIAPTPGWTCDVKEMRPQDLCGDDTCHACSRAPKSGEAA